MDVFPKFLIENYEPHVIKRNNILFIRDASRKKYLKLTPEEFVRQFFITYLNLFKNYPISNIQTETGVKYNNKSKRADILVYKDKNPILLVECKAMNVQINNRAIQQISNYQSVISASYLAITNGNFHFFYKKIADDWVVIDELPDYDAIELSQI